MEEHPSKFRETANLCGGTRERRTALHWRYWETFVATFNAQPLAARKARIERHLQARSQQQEGRGNGDANHQLTPEELQASIIRGPIEIDDGMWTLSLRR